MDVDDAAPVPVESVLLERIKVAASGRVSRQFLEDARLEVWIDAFSEDLVASLSRQVLAQALHSHQVQAEVTFRTPATTWQMFKHRTSDSRWLGWIARRWPVRMTETTKWAAVVCEHGLAYPDAMVALPPERFGVPVPFQRYGAQL